MKSPEKEKSRHMSLVAVLASILVFVGGANLAFSLAGSPGAEPLTLASAIRNGGTFVSGLAILCAAYLSLRATRKTEEG